MGNFFILSYPLRTGIFFVEKISYSPSDLLSRHTRGESLKSAEPEITIEYDAKLGELTDLVHKRPFLIVSRIVMKLIAEIATEEIEVFGVKVHSKVHPNEYFLINILDNVQAIDFGNSDMDLMAGTDVPLRVRKLVLDENRIGGRHIFRLNRLRTSVFVSQKLRLAIEASGATGFQFEELESFNEGIW